MRFAPPKLINKSDNQPLHSVRSTNVYEEKSLGIYEDDTSIDEGGISPSGNRVTVWGNYLAMHARRQLAFGTSPSHDHVRVAHHCRVDMWWLGLALFLLCIIEVCCPLSHFLIADHYLPSVTSSKTPKTRHGSTFLASVILTHVQLHSC